jgi:hypothetical protein
MFAALMAEASPARVFSVVSEVNGGEKVCAWPLPTWTETDPVSASPAAATVLKVPPEVCEVVNVRGFALTLESVTFAVTARLSLLFDTTDKL